MTTIDMEGFNQFLTQHNKVGDLKDEVLRHEMGATLNRNLLTQKEQGASTFTTVQMCWLVSGNPQWKPEHPIVQALVESALIDDDMELFRAAQRFGVIPASWTWIAWADGFCGEPEQLMPLLYGINDMSQRCAAACLATRQRPQAISTQLLLDMTHPKLATVYHLLLKRALNGPKAAQVALHALNSFAQNLEVLFSTDTDAVVALAISKSTLDHPEHLIVPYAEATSDLTRTALARRHLERNRPAEALALIKDLRFLSVAYDQAIVVAALAALEYGDLTQAAFYAPSVPDRQLSLKIQTRIAQAKGDAKAELEALVALSQMNPRDGQVFVQLVSLLDRTNNAELARQVCFQAQERFIDDPLVLAVIQRHALAARSIL